MGVFWLVVIAIIFYIFGRLVGLIYKLFIILIVVVYPLTLIGTVSAESYHEGIREVLWAYPNLCLYVFQLLWDAFSSGDIIEFIALIIASCAVFVPFSVGIYDSLTGIYSR